MNRESNNQRLSPIYVAAAVIEDSGGYVLLSRRAADAHQGGLWEFPGGKVEPGETHARALRRELFEELGIRVLMHEPLIRVSHSYPDKAVVLDVHRVTEYTGSPVGRQGQPLAWVDPRKLGTYPMPAADRPIVTAIGLPDTYLITGDESEEEESDFLERLDRALARGERLIQLRVPSAGEERFSELAGEALERCRRSDARLLLNAKPSLVAEIGADGLHINSRSLMSLTERPLDDSFLIAASCHNELELEQAERIGADFAVLSPVLPTKSHPGAKALGWKEFERLVESATIPVYSLGGMQPAHIGEAKRRGGQGIAAIGSLW